MTHRQRLDNLQQLMQFAMEGARTEFKDLEALHNAVLDLSHIEQMIVANLEKVEKIEAALHWGGDS